MNVAVIIPTVRGREESLGRAVASVAAESSRILTLEGFATCGEAWCEGIDILARDESWTHLMLFADDLEAHRGWSAATHWLESGLLPAPILLQADGTRWNSSDGLPGELCAFSRIVLCTRDQAADLVGFPSLHYYSDCLACELIGLPSVVAPEYVFTHHWHPVARRHDAEPDRVIYERSKP